MTPAIPNPTTGYENMAGLFATWQPRYAEAGIATFPVRDKRPAVKGYLKAGLKASEQFRGKFPGDDAFGFACRPNRITVLDVDAPDERLLRDAIDEFGPTPIIVRSGSGNFQAWYRHGGERRAVRPDPARPIDILGDGFVVAPPSRGAKGAYELIQGSLDDLADLPVMRGKPLPRQNVAPINDDLIGKGQRNVALWRACMTEARNSRTIEDLMTFASSFNDSGMIEPLPDTEVLGVVASAWTKTQAGENWFGAGQRLVLTFDDIDRMVQHPDAFALLAYLRRMNGHRETFVAANEMANHMPGEPWPLRRFRAVSTRTDSRGIPISAAL
ncbi:bifunctional DNA primase/polymerase [Croceicoccus gelatinilyticus]|uniref:bifunctional DNA primase/polymerase n=1 Tax=Croceicoccus gelatinilyticus TaxID=2835536 RepID=UPI001BCE0207|nr:bifunctional DNA primase/polymerase [Croceicoccus gelatinilyticus]MBS7670974.1 bifunctional DNA primase/polymerase [Croceicoccus gelatinilyticus]